MAMVQCKACGKIYDYEKNGCCPSCGAYNRPPRRERVDADGTVHHLTGQERRSVPRGGKVCFEKKECHEKKVCFEDQARRAREKLNSLSGPARQVSLVGVLVAGLIVLSLVSSIVSSCQARRTDYPVDPVTPATEESAVAREWLDWDTWQGGRVGLLGASYEDGVLQVELEIHRDPGDVLLDDLQLYCVDEDGQELTLPPFKGSCQEQYWTLHFDLSADWYDNLQYVELRLLAPGRDPGWISPSAIPGHERFDRLNGLTRPAEGSGPYEAPVDRTPVGRGPCAPPFCAPAAGDVGPYLALPLGELSPKVTERASPFFDK